MASVGSTVLPFTATDVTTGFSTTRKMTRTPSGTGSSRTTASANRPVARIAWTSFRTRSSFSGSFALVETALSTCSDGTCTLPCTTTSTTRWGGTTCGGTPGCGTNGDGATGPGGGTGTEGTGDVGVTGAAGDVGVTGDAGVTGDVGVTGAAGCVGLGGAWARSTGASHCPAERPASPGASTNATPSSSARDAAVPSTRICPCLLSSLGAVTPTSVSNTGVQRPRAYWRRAARSRTSAKAS